MLVIQSQNETNKQPQDAYGHNPSYFENKNGSKKGAQIAFFAFIFGGLSLVCLRVQQTQECLLK